MDLIKVAERISGTAMQYYENSLTMLNTTAQKIMDEMNSKLNSLEERKTEIKSKMIKIINEKAQVKVERLMKVGGIGKVIIAVTITDIVITDLYTPDGKLIGIRSCEDANGEYDWMWQHIPPNERIVIAYRNDGVKEGDILTC
jgi:hypothetical protein